MLLFLVYRLNRAHIDLFSETVHSLRLSMNTTVPSRHMRHEVIHILLLRSQMSVSLADCFGSSVFSIIKKDLNGNITVRWIYFCFTYQFILLFTYKTPDMAYCCCSFCADLDQMFALLFSLENKSSLCSGSCKVRHLAEYPRSRTRSPQRMA